MKVLQMNITKSQTMHHNWSYTKLFKSEESALMYLSTEFPNYNEITEDLKAEQSWNDNIPRTFEHELEQFDCDGEYDYPIESSITVEWVDVI